jgi:hypothetical protein
MLEEGMPWDCKAARREMIRSTATELTLTAATFSVWTFFYLNSITPEVHCTAEDTVTTEINMNTACQFIPTFHYVNRRFWVMIHFLRKVYLPFFTLKFENKHHLTNAGKTGRYSMFIL